MSKFKIRLTTVLAIALCLSAASFAQNYPFISFDAPDGANGTFPAKINASGQIVGRYSDSHKATHSFVRSADGQITEFDPPNLATFSAFDINSHGQIVGQGQNGHAYLRLANATFHEIDPPAAVSALPSGINDSGTITGQYSDASNVWHAFVLDRNGAYTLFDAPDAGTLSGTGTFATSINAGGEITGFYKDNSGTGASHVFIRHVSGSITEFDPPGSLNAGVWPVINSNGDVAGSYSDATFRGHGFLRDATGVITTIDRPGSSGTTVNSINDDGAMVGFTFSGGPAQGFRRSASGIYTTLIGPLTSDIVYPSSLNKRHVTGRYQDANGISHGFVQ